jgi:hypothetical protein
MVCRRCNGPSAHAHAHLRSVSNPSLRATPLRYACVKARLPSGVKQSSALSPNIEEISSAKCCQRWVGNLSPNFVSQPAGPLQPTRKLVPSWARGRKEPTVCSTSGAKLPASGIGHSATMSRPLPQIRASHSCRITRLL